MPLRLDVEHGTHVDRVDSNANRVARAAARRWVPEQITRLRDGRRPVRGVAIRYREWGLAHVSGAYLLFARQAARGAWGRVCQDTSDLNPRGRVRGRRCVAREGDLNGASANRHAHVGLRIRRRRRWNGERDGERHCAGRAELQRFPACRTRRARQVDWRKRDRDARVDRNNTTASTGSILTWALVTSAVVKKVPRSQRVCAAACRNAVSRAMTGSMPKLTA